MVDLGDFQGDIYSQFGEDAQIRVILDLMGVRYHKCVEFGASDGLSTSNTAVLREQRGFHGLLIESAPALFAQAVVNATHNEVCLNEAVTGDNIASLLDLSGFLESDLLSMDVDGDEYFIFEGLPPGSRLVVIEFNCSIPPYMDLRQAAPAQQMAFGASALALTRLAVLKGYRLLGLNLTNIFFIPVSEVHHFPLDWPCHLDPVEALRVVMGDRHYATVVSDQFGQTTMVDAETLYWGHRLGAPFPWTLVRGPNGW